MVLRWPAGVSSKDCMTHFTRMMVGHEQMRSGALDYCSRMPSVRNECFLYFIKGGCADGTLLSGLRACVPGLMAELRGQALHPEAAVRTGDIKGESWQNHGQLSQTRRNQSVNCCGLEAGREIESVLRDAMRRNHPVSSAPAPVYFDKQFDVLWNDTVGHRIAFHSDHVTGSYSSHDPITTLSWGCTGVLVLKPSGRNRSDQHLIVTRHGDVCIMGGEFRKYFLRDEPPVSQWQTLLDEHRGQLQLWEIAAMEVEIAQLGVDQQSVPRTRHTITIRWHHQHRSCLWAKIPLNLDAIPPATVVAAIPQFHFRSSAKPADAFKLGTGYRSFHQSPSTGAQPAAETGSSAASASSTACRVAVTVAATGSSEATACGDTRTSRKRVKVEMADVEVQTTEEMPRCNIESVLTETTNLVSAAYRAVEFLPTVLLACSFTVSEDEWTTEKPCLDSMLEYVHAMQVNLDRLQCFLIDMGVDQESLIHVMVHQNTNFLHMLRAALHARFALKKNVERLKISGATFLELKVQADQKVINNSHGLTKVTFSHAELQELLAHMDLPSFQKHGDIVFKLPKEIHQFHMIRDGEYRAARRGDMVFVGFIEIDFKSEAATRRMHLRLSPEQRGSWDNPEKATCVFENARSLLGQCLTHVRELDVLRRCCARSADSVSASYDVSIWICPQQSRLDQLHKKVTEDRLSPAASSSAAWAAWPTPSSSSDGRRDGWPSQQWQCDDPDASSSDVRRIGLQSQQWQ
jgi:hypothetical protein